MMTLSSSLEPQPTDGSLQSSPMCFARWSGLGSGKAQLIRLSIRIATACTIVRCLSHSLMDIQSQLSHLAANRCSPFLSPSFSFFLSFHPSPQCLAFADEILIELLSLVSLAIRIDRTKVITTENGSILNNRFVNLTLA